MRLGAALLLGLLVGLGAAITTAAQDSLGDVARQVREQRGKAGTKAAKVYTNDNLPAGSSAPSSASASGPSATPSSAQPSATRPAESAAEGAKKTEEDHDSAKGEAPEDKMKTEEYWQRRFKSARAKAARAEEEQQLVEDELSLLQTQQTREMDPTTKQQLSDKVEAKQTDVDAKRAAAVHARQALEDLESEFEESGAPEEWSKTD